MKSDSSIKVVGLSCRHEGLIAEKTLPRFGLKPNEPISSFVKRLRFSRCGSGSVMANRIRTSKAALRPRAWIPADDPARHADTGELA